MFAVGRLGNVFAQLYDRYTNGLEVSVAVLADLTPEETSHIAGILQKEIGPISESALLDCIRTIRGEYQRGKVSSADDLLALRERMKERKGIN